MNKGLGEDTDSHGDKIVSIESEYSTKLTYKQREVIKSLVKRAMDQVQNYPHIQHSDMIASIGYLSEAILRLL